MRRIKTTALASAAVSLALTAVASAQPPMYSPMPSWTGFYVGGNFGLSAAKSQINGPAVDFEGPFGLGPFGVIGGFQAGYNLQTAPNWVLGIEGDIQWSGERSHICAFSTDGEGCFPGHAFETISTEINWFSTVRGRVGYIPAGWSGLMFYATGGLAIAGIKTGICYSVDHEGPFCYSNSKTQLGYAVGAGIEGKMTRNLSWKVEYLFMDFGTIHGTLDGEGYSNRVTDSIFRVGLNWAFTPAP